MEVIVSENDEIIKTMLVDTPKDISGMLHSLEELRQNVNLFLTEKIEGEEDHDDCDETGSSSEDEDVKLPVTPNKRKKLP